MHTTYIHVAHDIYMYTCVHSCMHINRDYRRDNYYYNSVYCVCTHIYAYVL